MNRNLEAVLVVGASGLAAFGVTLVNLASGGTVDAQVGLTFVIFLLGFGTVSLALRRFAPRATPHLLPPLGLLAGIGIVEIYRLNPVRAGLQRWWLLIGAAAATATLWWMANNGVAVLRRYRNLMLVGAAALLALPMLPQDWAFPLRGNEVNGSRLWIVLDLGLVDLNFQPGEVAKLMLVLFLAAYLADRQPALVTARRRLGPFRVPEPRQLIPLLVVWLGSLGVLVAQRDLGASLLLFTVVVAMLYAATAEAGYLTGGLLLLLAGGVGAYRTFDHVQRRVTAWLDPFSDFEGAGYQIAQGIFGLGSGSLAGAGPGLGRPDLIPNALTDFIFAAVGEEFGFAGAVAVVAAYGLVVAVGFGIAVTARDRFRKLAAAGLTLVFAVQTFLILGGVLRVVPLTGIALPLMSYGGSAMLGNFVLAALLLRISHEEAT
jgi:peptidoglycan glycosyltransferase